MCVVKIQKLQASRVRFDSNTDGHSSPLFPRSMLLHTVIVSKTVSSVYRLLLSILLCAGRFGFAKDMGALNTLNTPPEQFENGLSDVDVLLGATKEIEDRMGGPHRAFQWWKRELWHGAYLLSRYQVTVELNLSTSHVMKISSSMSNKMIILWILHRGQIIHPSYHSDDWNDKILYWACGCQRKDI